LEIPTDQVNPHSVNVFAAIRLAVVIMEQQRPATSLDPTFFAAPLVVLAMLEVTTASICASIPIFWPAVNKFFRDVMVTHEVEVVSETREKAEAMLETDSTVADVRSESSLSNKYSGINDTETEVRVSGGESSSSGASRGGRNTPPWKFW
jgi:hypothetical protein